MVISILVRKEWIPTKARATETLPIAFLLGESTLAIVKQNFLVLSPLFGHVTLLGHFIHRTPIIDKRLVDDKKFCLQILSTRVLSRVLFDKWRKIFTVKLQNAIVKFAFSSFEKYSY